MSHVGEQINHLFSKGVKPRDLGKALQSLRKPKQRRLTDLDQQRIDELRRAAKGEL